MLECRNPQLVGFLTEKNMLGKVVDKLSPKEVIGQLSVHLLLVLLLKQLRIRPGKATYSTRSDMYILLRGIQPKHHIPGQHVLMESEI